MPLEETFDAAFVARLSLREKQIQQVYRPVIGIHKWFARRPGALFRSLLLAELTDGPLSESYWRGHRLRGVVADPFMGGGTPIFEATRLGLHVVGTDINPMSRWLVAQALQALDLELFRRRAEELHTDLGQRFGELYRTGCTYCGEQAAVKYFLWVKEQRCPKCHELNDLFPGYRLAEAERHPAHVLVCAGCGALSEHATPPGIETPALCEHCGAGLHLEGPARKNKVQCRHCGTTFRYPDNQDEAAPPSHRLWALEYHCPRCKPGRKGRFFKAPDSDDLHRFSLAEEQLAGSEAELPIPDDPIPAGDETDRLHRWGYSRYRETFNARQLLLLGNLLSRICDVAEEDVRRALLTVFSDFLRYQNMLCRYDTYALKCQDIFSVHGFPVGQVQCENNVLGIPRVGSGSFIHFVEKYARAKEYCAAPYERRTRAGRREKVSTPGEKIEATLTASFPEGEQQQAALLAGHATTFELPAGSLAGVFTDPPYFDNVQYAELMDYCYVWLRQGAPAELTAASTRQAQELTGNTTTGRGLEHFTAGLSEVFCHYAAALAPGAPFVFTYHHNALEAYSPLVVAILDAGLRCTAALPAAAEMTASLHIARTSSSKLDTVFLCRRDGSGEESQPLQLPDALAADRASLAEAEIELREGDLRCLAYGHLTRAAIAELTESWDADAAVEERLAGAQATLRRLSDAMDLAGSSAERFSE